LDSLISLADVTIGARFFCKLPSFLRHPLTLEQARATLRRRFEQREADFLAIARLGIYQRARSPYRQLLQLAGCEYGDLERLVSQDGVEGALLTLFRHGVYLTVDEFKGRRPAVRGSTDGGGPWPASQSVVGLPCAGPQQRQQEYGDPGAH